MADPSTEGETSTARPPSLLETLLPVAVLVALLGGAVYLFGDAASSGPNQIGLLISAGVAALIGLRLGHRWQELEQAIVNGISVTLRAILILLAVGALIGSWILAGVVPTMIAYGLELLSPRIFYPASCLICAVVALSIGSSWTVAGTIGVALMGVAASLGLSPAITAGAVISGAYFGDKMSPLSDTTNLAAAVGGAELFAHIGNMIWTTGPSLVVALVLFALLGSGNGGGEPDTLTATTAALRGEFVIGWPMLVPLAAVLLMAFRKVPALPTLAFGTLLGAVWALIFQPTAVAGFADRLGHGPVPEARAVWTALYGGYASATGVEALDDLLSRGGMASMLFTVWLIITAMTFGSVMERTGMLKRLISALLKSVRRTGSLIASTIAICIGTNILAADQYISLVAPGRMLRGAYERMGLTPRMLSRTLEDGGTLTSPLIPWNTCGAFMAGTLGVATFTYLPFAFFNLINPLVAILFGYAGIRVEYAGRECARPGENR